MIDQTSTCTGLRPPQQAVFCAVVLFCLLAAGHVLSSVSKPPKRAPVFQDQPNPYATCALDQFTGSDAGRMVPAVVTERNRTVWITNVSDKPWDDVHVQIGDPSAHHPATWTFASIRPRMSQEVLLGPAPESLRHQHKGLFVRCLCRVDHHPGKWFGYLEL